MRIRPIANSAAFTLLALTAVLAAGCTPPPGQPAGPRLYAIDQTGGAKSCVAPPVQPVDGRETAMEMKVGNDGGWCGVTLTRASGAFSAGLLTARPAHGRVYVHTVGSATRIDYTPAAAFAGADTFTVKMVPGDASVRVAVTVTP
jgi:hypothetical protein